MLNLYVFCHYVKCNLLYTLLIFVELCSLRPLKFNKFEISITLLKTY